MSDTLVRIKRAILAGHYAFSEKAGLELEADELTELDVVESIVNAVAIYKAIRSRSPYRKKDREYLHIIQGTNLLDSEKFSPRAIFKFLSIIGLRLSGAN